MSEDTAVLRRELAARLRDDTFLFLSGFRKYTGLTSGVGVMSVDNTPYQGDQLLYALALSRHPAVFELSTSSVIPYSSAPAVDRLVHEQVLRGMKILDLGCGAKPTFARCSRALGADTYTVDIIPAKQFGRIDLCGCVAICDCFDNCGENGGFDALLLSPEERAQEEQKHIAIDLREPAALETILRKTGGAFDLVTSAHLESGRKYDGKQMQFPAEAAAALAQKLLIPAGTYYNANRDLHAGKRTT